MKSLSHKLAVLFVLLIATTSLNAQDFNGKAYYATKSTLKLGRWGDNLSTAQKKQIQARLKNRLEKEYILVFNLKESLFKEDEKLDAMSGATDSWGKNFSQGDLYKNVKENVLIQDQEFYGKRFLVKDKPYKLQWEMSSEQKTIGEYACFKATATLPVVDLKWYDFSWDRIRESDSEKENIVTVEAWYTPQVPVSNGPSEFWGLPGLILEVSAGDTTMLCTRIEMNLKEKTKIEAPEKGTVVSKIEYREIVEKKMSEMRDMYRSRNR